MPPATPSSRRCTTRASPRSILTRRLPHPPPDRYWPLFDKLSPEAAKNVSYQNAYNHYFKNWDVPSGEGGERRYSRMESYYQTEMLDPKQGTFVTGKATELDDDGLY